jgi:hypothetical protein
VIYTGTGNNTFTMPSVSSNLVVGREIIIKNLGSGILKVAPNASDLIDNTSGIITLYPGEALTMVSISTTWVMI